MESEDLKEEDDESVEIPEAWIVYPDYPNQHNNYTSRRNQREWEVTQHDRCRSGLQEAT